MDLKDFVAKTLSEISEGIVEARSAKPNSNIGVSSHAKFNSLTPGFMQDVQGALCTGIDFDVAVTVAAEGTGSAGIKVFGIDLGGKAAASKETVSRVKFSVPMYFRG